MSAALGPLSDPNSFKGPSESWHLDEPDAGICPDCLPRSMCLACADCDEFHIRRDTWMEDR